MSGLIRTDGERPGANGWSSCSPATFIMTRTQRYVGSGRRSGRAISRTDAWQAAVALHEGVPLISHNRRDFAHVSGLTLISEAP